MDMVCNQIDQLELKKYTTEEYYINSDDGDEYDEESEESSSVYT